jgi:hypothetical protein
LGHGNGFAEPHAHDGVAGAQKGTAATMLTIGGEMLMVRTRNKEPPLASTSLAAVPKTAANNPATSACERTRQ